MHSYRKFLLLRIAALCLILPAWLAAPARGADTGLSEELLTTARAEIGRLLEGSPIASIAVAVARDGKILWEEAFGLADRERSIKATPQTIYSLASLTKPPTATAVMILAERGLLDIDKPANDYLGPAHLQDFAADANQVTIRHILSHTSGLPVYCRFFFQNDRDEEPGPDIVKAIRDYAFIYSEPGKTYNYSNLGYGILQHIIARVSGVPYETFMQNEVFEPLDMTHSAIGAPADRPELIAQRYDRDGKPVVDYDFEHRGGSAMYASAHDMLLFGMFHLKNRLPNQKRILTDAALDAMHRKDPAHPTGGPIGLGWRIHENSNYRCLSHTGRMPGVSTIIKLVPAENIAVVVLANTVDNRIYGIPDKILSAWLEDFPGAPVSKPDGPAPSPVPCPSTWAGAILTSAGEIPLDVTVNSEKDVEVRLDDRDTISLEDGRLRDDRLTGLAQTTIDHPDIHGRPHTLGFKLLYRGDETLSGWIMAQSSEFALPYRATLKKKP